MQPSVSDLFCVAARIQQHVCPALAVTQHAHDSVAQLLLQVLLGCTQLKRL